MANASRLTGEEVYDQVHRAVQKLLREASAETCTAKVNERASAEWEVWVNDVLVAECETKDLALHVMGIVFFALSVEAKKAAIQSPSGG